MGDPKILGYEVIEFSDVADEDCIPGLLYDYWRFDEAERYRYVYPATKLLEKYGIKSSHRLETLVKKNGRLLVKRRLDCNKCVSIDEINTRKEFAILANPSYWLAETNGFCKDCRAEEVKLDLTARLSAVQYKIESLDTGRLQASESSLSYLEKVFLFSLINYEDLNSQNACLRAWLNFSEHGACGAERVMQNLISTGFIIAFGNAYEIEEDALVAQRVLEDSRNILDNRFIINYKSSLKKLNLPKPEVFTPNNYSSPSEFSLKLLNDIKTATLSSSDIAQITNYVTNKRVSELNNLYFYICDLKKIPTSNTAKKILVFKKIAGKFNLLESMSIISYQATLMQAALYDKLRFNSHAHNANIFIKNIDGWVDRLIENTNIKEYYTKKLPDNWEVTQTEAIISLEILDLLDTWEKYSTKEILNIWFNKIPVE